MTYTIASVATVFVADGLDLVVLRTQLLTRRVFWASYAIVLAFQLLVNGVLTGLRIVRYDPRQIIGWRIAYAPVEDIGFGFGIVVATLAVWVWLGRHMDADDAD